MLPNQSVVHAEEQKQIETSKVKEVKDEKFLKGIQFSWSLIGQSSQSSEDIQYEFGKLDFNRETAKVKIHLKDYDKPHPMYTGTYASIKIQEASGKVLYAKDIIGDKKLNEETKEFSVAVGLE
ncbi:hypothetical protein CN507_07640 [Bacillus cereus]|nr:hypothetical protein CN507_07640 [Bacillus cereus]